jgi:hypothetical protein
MKTRSEKGIILRGRDERCVLGQLWMYSGNWKKRRKERAVENFVNADSDGIEPVTQHKVCSANSIHKVAK